MAFRFLRTRIVVAFVLLLFVVEAIGLAVINSVLTRNAQAGMRERLVEGEAIFNHVQLENGRLLTQASAILSADFGFRQAAAAADGATLLSALENQTARIHADIGMLNNVSGLVLANTRGDGLTGQPFPFPELIETARHNGRASAVVDLDGRLYELIVVPVLAPVPVAWLAMGFQIDDHFAADLKNLTSVEVSFLVHDATAHRWQLRATTLPALERGELVATVNDNPLLPASSTQVVVGSEGHEYLSSLVSVDGDRARTVAVLQSSVAAAEIPLQKLQERLIALALLSALATVLAGQWIGRSITRPVTVLSQFAQRLEKGDYSSAPSISRSDEIGALSSALNHMREGIAGREARIRELAYVDGRTGLPNRVAFLEALAQPHVRAAILVMDVDRFKEVNDILGHDTGDLLIEQIAQRLRSLCDASGTLLASLGGDEFAVLIEGANAQDGGVLGRRILRHLEDPIALDTLELAVSLSIGIAAAPEHGSELAEVMQRAEVAMYVAKQSGSGHALFEANQSGQSAERLALMTELRRAVTDGQLELHFQPKLELANRTVRQVEALVRWNHPTRGTLGAGHFIPFAESTGYIRNITKWVIDASLRQAALWRARGTPLRISVNISARDLSHHDLPRWFAEGLARHQVGADALTLEITESAIMDDPVSGPAILDTLRGMGFELSIDDFGTGYSSLAYLKRLPVSELKIDRSFVANMATDPADAQIVQSTIGLAHGMGLRVVAEGVEAAETLALLQTYGCDAVQGFHITPPLPVGEFEAWLAAGTRTSGRLRLAS